MTLKDKLEIGLKEDAPYRRDNLPNAQIAGPEVGAGAGRSPVLLAARKAAQDGLRRVAAAAGSAARKREVPTRSVDTVTPRPRARRRGLPKSIADGRQSAALEHEHTSRHGDEMARRTQSNRGERRTR
jgi:hypothetical protein